MGKASKWIRNFLMGKKEDKFKQIDAPSIEKKTAQTSIHIESPKVKRKWSFGRIAGKVAVHKFSTSFDSSDSAKLQIQAIVETPAPKTLPTAFSEVSKDIENAAATKIQAAFRSYLGRKALHALRGLVKIQALVRGHLVRRQTTATLRGMHALLAIQVRARIHRIQTAQEANFLGKQPEIPGGKAHQREKRDLKDTSLTEMLEVLKSRSGPLDRPSRKSIEHDSETLYSKPLSSSKRGHQYNYKKTLITAPNSPENYPTKSLSTSLRRSWEPNYMIKTESSRAKARCESEPKQRPKLGMRHNNKPTEPTKEFITSLDSRRQYLSSKSTRFNHGDLDYWAINLYE